MELTDRNHPQVRAFIDDLQAAVSIAIASGKIAYSRFVQLEKSFAGEPFYADPCDVRRCLPDDLASFLANQVPPDEFCVTRNRVNIESRVRNIAHAWAVTPNRVLFTIAYDHARQGQAFFAKLDEFAAGFPDRVAAVALLCQQARDRRNAVGSRVRTGRTKFCVGFVLGDVVAANELPFKDRRRKDDRGRAHEDEAHKDDAHKDEAQKDDAHNGARKDEESHEAPAHREDQTDRAHKESPSRQNNQRETDFVVAVATKDLAKTEQPAPIANLAHDLDASPFPIVEGHDNNELPETARDLSPEPYEEPSTVGFDSQQSDRIYPPSSEKENFDVCHDTGDASQHLFGLVGDLDYLPGGREDEDSDEFVGSDVEREQTLAVPFPTPAPSAAVPSTQAPSAPASPAPASPAPASPAPVSQTSSLHVQTSHTPHSSAAQILPTDNMTVSTEATAPVASGRIAAPPTTEHDSISNGNSNNNYKDREALIKEATLVQGQWLNDAIGDLCDTSPTTSYVDSISLERVLKQGQRPSRRVAESVWASSTTLLPLNVGNSHWVLVVVNHRERAAENISLYDSLQSLAGEKSAQRYVDEFLRHLLPATKQEHKGVTACPSPQQHNSVDCGVYVFFVASCLVARQPLMRDVCVGLWRRTMASWLGVHVADWMSLVPQPQSYHASQFFSLATKPTTTSAAATAAECPSPSPADKTLEELCRAFANAKERLLHQLAEEEAPITRIQQSALKAVQVLEAIHIGAQARVADTKAKLVAAKELTCFEQDGPGQTDDGCRVGAGEGKLEGDVKKAQALEERVRSTLREVNGVHKETIRFKSRHAKSREWVVGEV